MDQEFSDLKLVREPYDRLSNMLFNGFLLSSLAFSDFEDLHVSLTFSALGKAK